jgi:prepilin-type N-terminal cleavage/methylation domain-containing protein
MIKTYTMIKKGFTLIEMLVVISLIGILAALALVSFTSSQKQTRDVTRKSDLKQYQTTIENYANQNNGVYPIHATAITITMGTLCTELGMTTCFLDPKDPDLTYKYISDGTGYVFWSGLENKSVTTYWMVCSSGKNAESTTTPTLAGCL